MKCNIELENKCISVKEVKGNCAYNYLPGKKFSAQEIIPEGLCLHAFHTFFPYYLTLKNNGWFAWVKPQDGVCIHCPYPEGIIVKMFKDAKETVTVRVVNNPDNCFCHYSSNREFKLDKFKFCPRALDIIYPHLLKHNAGLYEVNCPSFNNNVVFQITIDNKVLSHE